MTIQSKTGAKAKAAADKVRTQAARLDRAARKRANCHTKLLAKNERKAKNRVARAKAVLSAKDAAHLAQGDRYEIRI